MKYLPYNYYEFESNLTPREIKDRLVKSVSEVVKFSNLSVFQNDDDYFFQGIIKSDSFIICRKIDRRKDSFRAIFSGKIETKNNKSIIKIKARLKWPVYIFMFIYTIPLVFVCFVLPLKLPFDEFKFETKNFMILIPYAMLFFSYLLFNIPFQEDSKNTMEFIKNIIR
ncbi:hypothetical protein [Flavobacterium sp. J27]|uniref:hypothetical protein n=1 Tax=Flavobacterium sp. J27 TaxID=2060419 RepID=UPI00103072DD|nr:hypothetical protein [Flavobacterium sp. J27]